MYASNAVTEGQGLEDAEAGGELNLWQIVNGIPAMISVMTAEGEVELVNRQILEYFGKTLEELKGWTTSDAVHPDDLPGVITTWKRSVETGRAYDLEHRMKGADGVYRWFGVQGLPMRDTEDRIVRWCVLQTVIDERKRADALLAGENSILEMIARGDALPLILDALCRLGEEVISGSLASLLLLDMKSSRLWNGAAPSLPDSYTQAIDGCTVGPDVGPCTMAASLSKPVIVSDIQSEIRWPLFRDLAITNGLRACWSTPILSSERKVLGTFALYWQTPAAPTPEQQNLIAQMTHLASVAIERSRANEELQAKQSLLGESEQRFRAIFDEAGTGITLVDLMSLMPIQNNRALQTMLGCTQEELGRFETYNELTCPENRDADATSFRKLCEGERDTLRQEKHFIRRDGRSVWANVIFTLLRDTAGLPRFIIAIHEDITERKHAVETLQAKQDLLDLAQKSARAMAFDWYIQQDVNVWSPEQEALYGLPPGSFDGTYQGWKKLIFPADWPLLLQAIEDAHETGEVAVEFRVVWPDESLHWLATRGEMFFDDQGKPFRMVGFTSDVTPRKLVEEELRRSEDALHKMRSELTHVARVSALGTLTASIAHEVNQPLAGIVINGQTSLRCLEADTLDLNGAREATQRIIRDANRAGEVIARLRSLFKKTGTTNLPLELTGIIQEVLALTDREIQKNKVVVRTLFANDMPPVLGDRVQVQQVLLNLILNAMEAMATVDDRPRELTIITQVTQDNYVQIAIKDSGVGLDKEAQQRMFDAFFSKKENGMGIGLSISRSIVGQLGGKLWAESQTDPGATFLFTLPVLREEQHKEVSVSA